MDGGKRLKSIRKSIRKSAKKSTRRSARRSVGKVPPGYQGSVRPGDKLEFYWPQHGPVTTQVTSINKTKNKRFQAVGKSRTGAKLYQFVSGNN